jgi:ribosome biogenesis GTPase
LSGTGIVLASYGRGALVQAGESVLHCGLVGRKLRLVCGDRVQWRQPEAGGAPSVQSVSARRNVIERIDARGRAEPVAANIDRLAIVIAPQPAPDWFLVDRYWAGAINKDIDTCLIINKQDLGTGEIEPELGIYAGLGLPSLRTACHSGAGIDALRRLLQGAVTLFVGQSGVGKSSIVNALAPHAAAQTAQLTRDAEGRHTTTTARWYRLGTEAAGAAESAIIDAPGVRDFAPPAHIVRAAQRGFTEIHALSEHCRFNDCRHFDEPGCRVREELGAGRVAARRYESYRRLARLYEGLAQ